MSSTRACLKTRSEKSGAKGANTCTILGGRVRTLRSPLLAETGDESVPYPFRSQMAKVEPRACLVKVGVKRFWRSPGRGRSISAYLLIALFGRDASRTKEAAL